MLVMGTPTLEDEHQGRIRSAGGQDRGKRPSESEGCTVRPRPLAPNRRCPAAQARSAQGHGPDEQPQRMLPEP